MKPEMMADESSDEGSTTKDSPRIIIIGAGISGITAANFLAKAGYNDFVVLEASNRTGGRIQSVDLETANGTKAEMGANWIHGIDRNPIFNICMQNNMLPPAYQGRQLGRKMMFLQESGEPVNTKVVEEVDWLYGTLMSQCEEFYQDRLPTPVENDSVGDFCDREFSFRFSNQSPKDFRMRKMIFDQRLLGECIISGANSMSDVSLSEVGAFEELPGVHYVIPPGFEAVVDLLKRDIPPESLLLEHPVTRVAWNNSANPDNANTNQYQVCVECRNGKRFYADHVLVTCSLGYLKEHHKRMFDPPLPNYKADTIDRICIGTVNKVVLEFEERVFPEGVFRLEMIWDRESIEQEDLSERWVKKIGSFETINERGNVVIGWLSGKEAEFMETLTEEEVARKVTSVLKTFLKKQRKDFPKLHRCFRSTWKENPYTLGSYSYIPVGARIEDIETLGEPVCDNRDRPVLLFAGEATHPSFYSSSHGALLTGEREAQRIIDLYSH